MSRENEKPLSLREFIEKIEELDHLPPPPLPPPPSYHPKRQYGFKLSQFEVPLTFLLPMLTAFVFGMVSRHILNGDSQGTLIAMVGGATLGLALKMEIFKLLK